MLGYCLPTSRQYIVLSVHDTDTVSALTSSFFFWGGGLHFLHLNPRSIPTLGNYFLPQEKYISFLNTGNILGTVGSFLSYTLKTWIVSGNTLIKVFHKHKAKCVCPTFFSGNLEVFLSDWLRFSVYMTVLSAAVLTNPLTHFLVTCEL